MCFCPCPSASFTLKIWPLGNHGSQSGMGVSLCFSFCVLVHLWCLCPCVSWFSGNLRHLRRCFFKRSSQDTNVHIQHCEVALEYEVTHLPVYKAQTGLWLVLWNRANWDDKNFQLPAAKKDISCSKMESELGGKNRLPICGRYQFKKKKKKSCSISDKTKS